VAGNRKYAVQKPKGKAWETLSLVDDLGSGKHEFTEAVRQHGKGYVRLIQVDFESEEPLSNYDWRLVELHDPFKGQGGFKPTVIAGSEKARPPKKKAPPATRPGKPRGPGDKVPVPVTTYMAALLFGALAVLLWAFFYEF